MLVCDAKGKRGGVDAADPSARGVTPTDAFYTEEASWLRRARVEVGRDEAWQGGRPTGKTVLSIGLIIEQMHSYMLNSTISTSAQGIVRQDQLRMVLLIH